jgi:ABC-type spermidine/putrescine transport system permease subunit II
MTRWTKSDYLLAGVTGALVLFSLFPLLTIALFSVNDFPFYSFPLRGLTMKWYSQFFQDTEIRDALWNSIYLTLVVAVIATFLGTCYAFAVARLSGKRQMLALLLGLGPLVTPVLMLAIGSQVLFVEAGVPLSKATVVFAQTMAFTPFVILVIVARLFSFPWSLPAAARDLGASWPRAFFHVTLPIVRPAIQSGFLVAFLLPFNEFLLAFFTGRGFNTLPILTYSRQRLGISPTLLAQATLTIAVVATVAFSVQSMIASFAKKRGQIA